MPIHVPKSNYESVTPGRYHGQVTKLAIKDIKQSEGTTANLLEFTVLILSDGPEQMKTTNGLCSLTYSEKSKLYKWAKALNGGIAIEVPDGASFDAEILLNRDAWIIVSEGNNGNTRVGGPEDVVAIIRDVAPPPPAPVVPPAASYPPQGQPQYQQGPPPAPAPGYPAAPPSIPI